MYIIFPLLPLLFVIFFFAVGILGILKEIVAHFINWLAPSISGPIPILVAIIRIALFSLLIPLLKKHKFKQTIILFVLDVTKTFVFFRIIHILILLCHKGSSLSGLLNMTVWGIVALIIFFVCLIGDVIGIRAAFADPIHSDASQYFMATACSIIGCYVLYLLFHIPDFIDWIITTTMNATT